MNETEIRERLFELAADAPERLSVPPQLLRRARRRVGITLTSLAVLVLTLGSAGIAGVRWLNRTAWEPAVRPTPTPVDQSPVPDGAALPELHRDGEVIMTGRPSEGRDLVAIDPDTGDTRTLISGEDMQGRIGSAAWSPDGRWLAYDIAIESALWVENAQDEPRQLAVKAGRWAWSPTDAQLAVMRSSILGVVDELVLLDPSTGRETDLGPTIGDVTTSPVWSADGTRIMYGARGGWVYSVDVESGEHALLVRLPGNLDSIDGIEWSPDGAHVAILADLVGALRRLYVMDADGSRLRVLVDNFEPGGWPAWFPDPSSVTAWSPDGTRLVYPNFSGPDQRELEIWTVSLDGSAPSLIVSHTNRECCIDGGAPVWSPDGSQIAFETDNAQLVVNADGTGHPSDIDELAYLGWRGGWYFCFCYG